MKQAIYILTSLEVGGAQKALFNLLNSELSEAYPPRVISLQPSRNDLQAMFLQAGIPCETIHLKQPIKALPKIWQLIKDCRQPEVELIHGWMHHGNLFASLMWWLSGKHSALLWSMHHTPENQHRRWHHRLILKWGQWLSSWPDRIVYVSARSLQRHTELQFKADKAVVIPNGIPVAEDDQPPLSQAQARAQLGIPEQHFVIGSLTRFVQEKDIPNLMTAAALFKQHSNDFTLLLAGVGMTDSNEELMDLIEQHDLHKQVRLLGVCQDVQPLLYSMDLATLSSRREAFPLFLAEAMAASVPVVATDVGDIAEFIADTGWVVPRMDAEALSQAWLTCYQLDATAGQQLGRRARQRVRKTYSMKRVIAAYQAMYDTFP